MKYIDNMTPEERAKFIEEVNELDAMLSALPNPTPHNPTRRKQMKTVNDMVGKTIKSVEYRDPWSMGMHITFTDGTTLSVFERMQAGEIDVIYDHDVMVSDHHNEAEKDD